MPRTPDPGLEGKILDAALHILDTEGMNAVTMRRVAVESSTTTPTLYERFPSRAALKEALFLRIVREIMAMLEGVNSVEEMVRIYLDYIVRHPHRLETYGDEFGRRYAAGKEQPLFVLLRDHLQAKIRVPGARIECLAIGIVLLAQGAQDAISAAGADSEAAALFRRVALESVKTLIVSAKPR